MSYPDRPITIKVDGLNQVHNHFVSISEGTHDKLSVRSLVLSSLGILSDENLTVSHSVGGWKDWIKLEGPGTVTVTNESEFDVVMSKPLRPVFVNPENKRYFIPVPSGKRSVSTLARTILSALRQHKVFADKEMTSSRVFHRASAGASWKELSRYESKKVVVDVVPSSSFMVERVKDVSHALKPVYAGQQKVWVPVETGNVSNETVITAIKNKLGITAADTKCQVYHFPTRWSRGTLMEDGGTITVTHESLFSVLHGGAGGGPTQDKELLHCAAALSMLARQPTCERYAKRGFIRLMTDLLAQGKPFGKSEGCVAGALLGLKPAQFWSVEDCKPAYMWLLKHGLIPAHVAAGVDAAAVRQHVRLGQRAEPLNIAAVRAGTKHCRYRLNGLRKLMLDLLPGNTRLRKTNRRRLFGHRDFKSLTVDDLRPVYKWLLGCGLVPADVACRVRVDAASKHVLLTKRAAPLDCAAVAAALEAAAPLKRRRVEEAVPADVL